MTTVQKSLLEHGLQLWLSECIDGRHESPVVGPLTTTTKTHNNLPWFLRRLHGLNEANARYSDLVYEKTNAAQPGCAAGWCEDALVRGVVSDMDGAADVACRAVFGNTVLLETRLPKPW